MSKEQFYLGKKVVEKGGYAVGDLSSKDLLVTYNLGKEVCFSLYSNAWGKAALARALNDDAIHLLMQEFTANALDVSAPKHIDVKIIAGPAAKMEDVEKVREQLAACEKDHYQFNIVNAEVTKFHSLEFEPSRNRLEPHQAMKSDIVARPEGYFGR